MSYDNFTYAEQTYFDTIPGYRSSVMDFLRSRGLPLRLASYGDETPKVSAFANMMSHIKGSAMGRSKHRRGKWRHVRRRRY